MEYTKQQLLDVLVQCRDWCSKHRLRTSDFYETLKHGTIEQQVLLDYFVYKQGNSYNEYYPDNVEWFNTAIIKTISDDRFED